jgi:general secretion pathway protein F
MSTAFRWEAVDAQGRVKQGVLEADTARAVRDQLRAGGLTPTAVDESAARRETFASVRLPAPLLALTTRQLATLALSGMPLDQALAAVAEQADDARAAKIATSLRSHVAAGESLPAALARYPRTFSPLYRGLVGAGAETGRLAEVLSRLSDYLEAREALRQKVILALIYPAVVTVIAFGVIAVLLVYVVPQVVSVYQQSRQTLPWLTQALISTSAFFRATGWLWLAGLIAACVAFALALRRPAFCARWHAGLLRTPVVGRLLRSLDTARFASTLAILTASGAPLLRSLDAAAEVVRRIPLREAAARAASLVREGVALSRALREQKVFPPVLVHLVANGEQTGRLATMLERAAGELERDAERRLAWLAALLQPALIVIMGGIVLVLVLAVMLPIVSMNQLIR